VYTSALMAFLHHLAAFTVVGALARSRAVQAPLTVVQARRLQRADQIFGAAATVLLVVGLLRVFYFEKAPVLLREYILPDESSRCFIVAALISSIPPCCSSRGTRRSSRVRCRPSHPQATTRGTHVHDVGADGHPRDPAMRPAHGAGDRLTSACAAHRSIH